MTNDEKYQYFSKIATKYLDKEDKLVGNEQEIALIAFTEIQINNGGFLSFFEHSNTKNRQEIYCIYEKIGAIKCLQLLKKFQAILDRLPKNIDIEHLLSSINEFDDDINKLNEQYWEISEEVFILAYNYYIQPKDAKL